MVENPYRSPRDNVPNAPPKPHHSASGKQPFSLLAAKLSLCAPFILFLFNCFSAVSEIASLTTLAAFVFGIGGLVGGIGRGAVGTTVIAALGIVLNGLVIALTISAYVSVAHG